ncbi:MAG: hypothetical protein EBY32_15815 [Proteobacteria bacterium]|nr:hypothetical protein [Pseudomonadota bacterium]
MGAALAFGAFSALAGVATTGAATGAGADLVSFFAGILFDLTTEEEADISNALVYYYPTAVM